MPKFAKSTGYKQSPASMIAGTKAHKAALKNVQPPLYQKVVKEGEGQDENKIYKKGVHVGNYVNDKAVYFDWYDEQRKPEATKETKEAPVKQFDIKSEKKTSKFASLTTAKHGEYSYDPRIMAIRKSEGTIAQQHQKRLKNNPQHIKKD